MDQNDAANKLAQAAFDAVRGDLDALRRALEEQKPTTTTLAQAYTLCLTMAPFSGTQATGLVLQTLQYALAEKAAHQLTVLTRWLVALTVVLTVFGVVDVLLRLRSCG